MSGDTRNCDLAIIGGGLSGSVLALALAQTSLDVVIVEARDPRRLEQPSFDSRATALANGSQRVLATLGIWTAVADEASPIRSIHVSERGQFGAARIDARAEGVSALGYLLENRVLGAALWDRLDSTDDVSVIAPAVVESVEAHADAVELELGSEAGAQRLRARLVVAADGAHSQIRSALGIAALEDDYAQRAVIVNCRTDVAHAGRAFERFTTDGPIAMLPLSGERVAAVWTLPDSHAERVMQLDDVAFTRALQAAFGYRLGRFVEMGRRVAYPLSRLRSTAIVAPRAVLIGSAAVNLHPVAGQGFNLAVRDVAVLAEVLSDALLASGADFDPGEADTLARYADWRYADQKRVAAFTHGLIEFFGHDSRALGVLRGLGLMAFDLTPGAKAALARHTMGLAGKLSRLARGLPLLPRAR